MKQWTDAMRKKRDAIIKRYRSSPKGKAMLAKHRKNRSHVKYLYGITIDQYNAILKEQHGTCAVCHEVNENGAKLTVYCPKPGPTY